MFSKHVLFTFQFRTNVEWGGEGWSYFSTENLKILIRQHLFVHPRKYYEEYGGQIFAFSDRFSGGLLAEVRGLGKKLEI